MSIAILNQWAEEQRSKLHEKGIKLVSYGVSDTHDLWECVMHDGKLFRAFGIDGRFMRTGSREDLRLACEREMRHALKLKETA